MGGQVIMLTVYNFHTNPEKLFGFERAEFEIPELAWARTEYSERERKQLEHVWAKDPEYAYRYATTTGHRFILGEPVIATDPQYAWIYATNIIRDRWPQGEAAIATDGLLAQMYAEQFLKRPWPQGEPAIALRSVAAYQYARFVLKGPWPKNNPNSKTAEQSIASEGSIAAEYSLYVLHRRFPMGEPAIAKTVAYQQAYEKRWGIELS